MCIDLFKKSDDKKEKPSVFFKSITFNDGTTISLEQNSIVVFTGANNSGKSQVLKDLENILDQNREMPTIVLNNAEYEFYGDIDESKFLGENFSLNEQGQYQQINSGNSFQIKTLKSWWKSHQLYSGMHKLFVKRLNTEIRLTVSNAPQRNYEAERHPVLKLLKSEALSEKISDYFHQSFGVDLLLNRNDLCTLPLHVGKAPNSDAYTIKNQDEYYEKVSRLPKLQNQGDGMRSFASILLDTFTSEYPITLIDEPEAFLHPPQARVLGKMLAKNNPDNRQLFISTHSEDFLQGLLDAENENTTVIRINRQENINKMNVLENKEIKRLWSNPILRYSNILSGLFHEKVIVCESDYDCLFYQAVMNAMYENKNEIAPDILFTHCGGKQRAKDVVIALKAVNVPVIAVCDFDLLRDIGDFKSLVNAFGIDWKNTVYSEYKPILDSFNAKKSAGTDVWSYLKKTGKEGLDGDEPAAYEKVEFICKLFGLFIVPIGEMERFDKTINKDKKDWVYEVLEIYDLATEPKLELARKFVQEIVNFKID